MIKCPCRDCAERTLTCHHEGNCEKYKQYRAQIEKIKEENKRETDIISARVDSINRRKRRKNAKGYY